MKYKIVELAKELAGAWYENGVNDFGDHLSKRFYKVWPKVDVFVARNWPKYLEAARLTLVTMLAAPDSAIPPKIKEDIYEDLMAYEERRMRQPSAKVGRGDLKLRPDQPGTLEQKIFWKQ
jgi:hypothetical protein